MMSLDQIYGKLDPRTPITNSGAVTISVPGSYRLATNITVSSGDAITISANNVTLDLSGFTISSTKASAGGTAILLSGGRTNVTIHNGNIYSGVTNNAGVYAGPGFANGVFYSGGNNCNVRIRDVSVYGCLSNGIFLDFSAAGLGNSTLVESCVVQTVGGGGIQASTVLRSTANFCGLTAINADNVSECFGYSSGSGYGVSALQTANNCYGYSTTDIGVNANIANNCNGYSANANATFSGGVVASCVANCYGFCAGNGYGINTSTAYNCYGQNNGTGVGLYALIANNCGGGSLSGFGLEVNYIAIGCIGESDGIGLSAYIANSSYSTTEAVTNKYNMK